MDRDSIIATVGGTGVSVIQCLNPEWIGQIVVGAIIGAVVSFLISRALTYISKKICK